MSLFRNKKPNLPDLISAADFDEVANYESALSYLIGLSDDDYAKVCKVAEIHRKSYQEAAAVLGEPNEPTTFIKLPEDSVLDPATAESIADTLLETEPKPRGKKVKVD